MTDTSEWRGRTGTAWADEWRRTDRSFTGLTERLLQRSREFAFSTALDIGCGAGELSLALARGRPGVAVAGVDISAQLIAAARARASHLANVSFHCADAGQWQPEGAAPDLLISRHGVMFFDDSRGAFSHLAEIAAPGAGLLFSCFRSRAENPFFTEIAGLLPEQEEAPGDAPGPFRFADAAKMEALLAQSGWRDVALERFDFAMIAGAGADPVEDAVAYYSTIGPAARALSAMHEGARAEFLDQLRPLLRRNCSEGIVALRAGVWLVSARTA